MVLVGLVVCEVVCEVEALEVALVVPDDVAVVVPLVVGVVATQSWNFPAAYDAAMAFNVAAASEQLVASNKYLVNAHCTVSSATLPSPAAPRKDRIAALTCADAELHSPAGAASSCLAPTVSHDNSPAVPVQVPMMRLSRSACPSHA